MAEVDRARALTYLQFEMYKSRKLPKIAPTITTEGYLAWFDETALILQRWYLENGEDLLNDLYYLNDICSEEGLYLMSFGFVAFPYKENPVIFRILVVPADHMRAKYTNMAFRTERAVIHSH